MCNRSLDKAEAYVQAAGLERDAVFVCSDWREVLARPDVDAVIVALPVYLNLEVATAAAAAGKHALLEKPTAHDLADASALVRLSHERRDEVAIMIGENYPYKNSLRTMARLVMGACHSRRPRVAGELTVCAVRCIMCRVVCRVAEGAVGSVVTFSLHFWRMFAPDNNPYLYTSWRQNPKHIGGILSGPCLRFSFPFPFLLAPSCWCVRLPLVSYTHHRTRTHTHTYRFWSALGVRRDHRAWAGSLRGRLHPPDSA